MARPRSVSDEEVYEAVRGAVLAQGAQVSLDVVASKLGVTAPALFRRFGSRQELMLQALRPPEPEFVADLRRGPDERPVEEQLTELFMKITHYMTESMPCLTALRESGVPLTQIFHGLDNTPPVIAMRAMAGWLDRLVERGRIAVPDTTGAAMSILGAVHMPVFLRHLTKQKEPGSTEAASRALARLVLQGIEPRPGHRQTTVAARRPRPARKRTWHRKERS